MYYALLVLSLLLPPIYAVSHSDSNDSAQLKDFGSHVHAVESFGEKLVVLAGKRIQIYSVTQGPELGNNVELKKGFSTTHGFDDGAVVEFSVHGKSALLCSSKECRLEPSRCKKLH